MLNLVEKDSAVNLPKQICDLILKRIRAGYYIPNKKLDSIRKLSDELNVSRVTVIEALKLLERGNYIERIPAKGTFVANDVNHELSLIKIALPFPEEAISLSSLGTLENWGIVSEVYHGMVEEARKRNAEIFFMHFEETSDEIKLSRQLRSLKNMNSAIFIGHQLPKLLERLSENGKFCIKIDSSSKIVTSTHITSDLRNAFSELATLAKMKNYKRLRIIGGGHVDEGLKVKLEVIMDVFKQAGIATDSDWYYAIDFTEAKNFEKIFASGDIDPYSGTDIIYYSNTHNVSDFYRYCLSNDIKLGNGLGVFGYANGVTFANLIPSFTYSKINHFEMGRLACALCIEAAYGDKHPNCVKLVKNTLIKGESV